MSPHACLGITALGQCTGTSGIYFDLGEAVAALGFILAVQQLLRPIYRFRLRVRNTTLPRIYLAVFVGVFLVAVASLIPSLKSNPDSPLGYPVLWELAATLAFVMAYGTVVLAVVKPVRVRPKSVELFAQTSAWLLSAAEERDHVDYLQDLSVSLPELILAASFGENRFGETSAFFDFTYRRELSRASYAWSLLRILSDPVFCATLVSRAPWLTASMISDIAQKRLYSRGAEQFIREIAKQAILRDDGMMEREIGYQGFGAAPLLSDSLFSLRFIVGRYDPLDSFRFMGGKTASAGIVRRFNSAAEKVLTSSIEKGDIWQSQSAYSIRDYSKSLFMQAQELRKQNDTDIIFELNRTVELSLNMANKLQERATKQQLDGLYVFDTSKYRGDTLETLVAIVYDALAFASNHFEGSNDPFWFVCSEAFHQAFPSFGDVPDGMTPFQQRLAIRLIKKLHDNMNGYFPSLCRVMLTFLGPYVHDVEQPNRTAFRILKDAAYRELINLSDIPSDSPGKIEDYLPPNITYDVATKVLKFSRDRTTDLSALVIQPVSLHPGSIRPYPVVSGDLLRD
jgi:hypothetical protein